MIALLAFVVEDVVDQIILTIEKIALVTITNVALLAIYRSKQVHNKHTIQNNAIMHNTTKQ